MRMTATGIVRCPIGVAHMFNFDHPHRSWPSLACLYLPKMRGMSPDLCRAMLSSLTPHNSLCPVDSILTRMGAYDNMFSNASTFKVELDEWYGLEVYALCRNVDKPSLAARSFVMLRRSHSLSSTSLGAGLLHTCVHPNMHYWRVYSTRYL